MIVNRRRVMQNIDSSARLYIQDGLIFMFDGIENAGFGKHTNDPTEIKDCIKGARLNPPDNGTPLVFVCEENALYVDKQYGEGWYFNVEGISDIFTGGTTTNEICCQPSTETISIYNKQEWGLRVSLGNYILRWLQNSSELNVQRNSRYLYVPSRDAATVASFNKNHTVAKTYSDIIPSLSTSWSYGQTYCNAIKSNSVKDFWPGVTYNNQSTILFGLSPQEEDKNCHPYRVYNFRFYNRELTSEEIAYNHSIDKMRFNLLN